MPVRGLCEVVVRRDDRMVRDLQRVGGVVGQSEVDVLRLLCLDHLHQCQPILYNKKMVLYNKEVDHGFFFWERGDTIPSETSR